MAELDGINLAMQTPMHDDGSIDFARWEALIETYIDAGVHGLEVCDLSLVRGDLQGRGLWRPPPQSRFLSARPTGQRHHCSCSCQPLKGSPPSN